MSNYPKKSGDMFETWKRMQRNDPADEIFSETENRDLYAIFRKINFSVFYTSMLIAGVVSILPFRVLESTLASELVEFGMSSFENVKSNYEILEFLRRGLGIRYVVVFVLCLGLVATSILVVIVYSYLQRFKNFEKLTRFQLKSLPIRFLLLLVCVWVAFGLNLSALTSRHDSAMGEVFLNYIYIFGVAFVFFGIHGVVYFFVASAMKILRYKGELIDG